MAINWRGEVKRPNQLSTEEIALWKQICAKNVHLRSPFFSFAFTSCVEAVRPDTRVCLLYRGSTLEGFFPFQYQNGFAQIVGAGERVGGELNDFFGVILDASSDISQQDLLRCAKLQHFTFSHMEQHQLSYGLQAQTKRVGFRVTLANGIDQFWKDVKSSHRDKLNNLMNRERKIERDFRDVRFTFNEPDIPSTLEHLLVEKRSQYAKNETSDSLSPNWIRACLHHIGAQNDPSCAPVMSSLNLDGEWASLHFGIRSERIFHYWFPVYNPKFSNLSPGLVLLRKMINGAADQGIQEIDFGEGQSPYKEWLSTEGYENFRGAWSRGGIGSLMYKTFLSASWRVQAWQHR